MLAFIFYAGAVTIFASSQFGPDSSWAKATTKAQIAPIVRFAALLAILIPLFVWLLGPSLMPVTPAQMKKHVESFDAAPYQMVSWGKWEVPARWAIETGLAPDLTRPRQLLARTIANEADAFTLGTAFRVGLITTDQIPGLPGYKDKRRSLFNRFYAPMVSSPVISLGHEDWIIRAAVLDGSLTAEERDYLEIRLHITLERLKSETYDVLADALRVTRLLAVIGRPVDPDRHRPLIHRLLLDLHCQSGGGFQVAGGFKQYAQATTGSDESTEWAIELMEVYGVPEGLDLNWVRSFLRPSWSVMSDKWIMAVARERLNRLPGARPPTWSEIILHERTLIAALVLVGLCFLATMTSPRRPANHQRIPLDLHG